MNSVLNSGWFVVALFYLLPAIALLRFRSERGSLLRVILKTAMYGWCVVAVLTTIGSLFEKHPSFTPRGSIFAATMFALVAAPLVGLGLWALNGMYPAGFRLRGKSVEYHPDLDQNKAPANELRDRDLRDGA